MNQMCRKWKLIFIYLKVCNKLNAFVRDALLTTFFPLRYCGECHEWSCHVYHIVELSLVHVATKMDAVEDAWPTFYISLICGCDGQRWFHLISTNSVLIEYCCAQCHKTERRRHDAMTKRRIKRSLTLCSVEYSTNHKNTQLREFLSFVGYRFYRAENYWKWNACWLSNW